MYESKDEPVIDATQFAHRVIWHTLIALGLILLSLGLGMAGYMAFEKLPVVDAFLNASMLLGGMGPVNPPQTTAGKLFAGTYALYAGLVFIAVAALAFAPVFHRLLHSFHLDDSS